MSAFKDVAFKDERAIADFQYANYADHNTYIDTLREQGLQAFNVIPVDMDMTTEDWLYAHNNAHHEVFMLLQVGGFEDLLSWDLTDEGQWNDWHAIHYTSHSILNQTMNLT
jgi:hypothetical protein